MEEKEANVIGVNVEAQNQHTPNEIMQQMVDALITAVHLRVMTGETAASVVEIMRELIHWSFMKPGTHGTPAELLTETMQIVGDFGVPGKDGKPQKFDA